MPKNKKVIDHIHKLKKIKYTNGESIFFCISGACEYEINVKKALGKPNLCHRCGKEFNLTEISLRLSKPHCASCTKGKRNDRTEETRKAVLSNLPIPEIMDLRSRLKKTLGESLSSLSAEDDLL